MSEIKKVTNIDLIDNGSGFFLEVINNESETMITNANQTTTTTIITTTTTIRLDAGIQLSIDKKDTMTYSLGALNIPSQRFLYDGISDDITLGFVRQRESGIAIWDMGFVGGEDVRDGLNNQNFRLGLTTDVFLQMTKAGTDKARIKVIKSQ